MHQKPHPEDEELYALLMATDKKNPAPTDIERLKQYLMKEPAGCAAMGNLSIQAQLQIIENATSSGAAAVCIKKYCEIQRDTLGYKEANAIERSLIEHVVLCWLRLYTCELRYERNMQSDMTLSQCLYWEKKLSENQKRYLRSVETLMRVRRLAKEPRSPVVNMLLKQQLNIR